jgi:hypothetical protein
VTPNIVRSVPVNVVPGLSVTCVVLFGVLAASAPAGAESCATEVNATTITLRKDQSSTSGEQLGQFNCWMPKAPASDKNLCQNDSATAHTFSITLANQCDVPVKLMLNLMGGGSLNFQGTDCGAGAVLFNDFVPGGGGSRLFQCTSQTYSTRQAKRATDFELKAMSVDDGNGPPTPVNVKYDPEIAVKDPSGIAVHKGLWALAIIGGGLLLWFIARRFRSAAH